MKLKLETMKNSPFYISTENLIYDECDNYKQSLAVKNKIAKSRLVRVNKAITEERKRLKAIIADHEKKINDLVGYRKQFKKEIEQVSTEYSFRRKINALLKKHGYLSVWWDGDEDVFTTWVYSDDFDAEKDFEGDPFQAEHFCDDYEEAYERCLAYIEHHETKNRAAN
jgi:hypothetical protein